MGTTRREVLGSSGVLSREGILRRLWVETVVTEINDVKRNTRDFPESLRTCSGLGLELGNVACFPRVSMRCANTRGCGYSRS